MRLLLVEDTERLSQLLSEVVHSANWAIDPVKTVEEAKEAIRTVPYDLLVIDLGLPDGDGIELIKYIRTNRHQQPILIITARGGIDDKIAGLDAGADDYLVKPFNHSEFLARCRAVLRRPKNTTNPTLTAGKITYDPAQGVALCSNENLDLAPRERTILEVLMRETGRVVAKRKLEHALSEFGDEMSSNAVEVAVSRLRKKLEKYPTETSLETVRGVGYLLREMTS